MSYSFNLCDVYRVIQNKLDSLPLMISDCVLQGSSYSIYYVHVVSYLQYTIYRKWHHVWSQSWTELTILITSLSSIIWSHLLYEVYRISTKQPFRKETLSFLGWQGQGKKKKRCWFGVTKVWTIGQGGGRIFFFIIIIFKKFLMCVLCSCTIKLNKTKKQQHNFIPLSCAPFQCFIALICQKSKSKSGIFLVKLSTETPCCSKKNHQKPSLKI